MHTMEYFRHIKDEQKVVDVVDEFLKSNEPVSEISLYLWSECASDAQQSHNVLLKTFSDAVRDISDSWGAPQYNGSGPSGGGILDIFHSDEFGIDSRAEEFCFWRLPGKIIKLEQSMHDARTLVDITLTVIDIEGCKILRRKNAEKMVQFRKEFEEKTKTKRNTKWWKFW
jgi:hypothetical protein